MAYQFPLVLELHSHLYTFFCYYFNGFLVFIASLNKWSLWYLLHLLPPVIQICIDIFSLGEIKIMLDLLSDLPSHYNIYPSAFPYWYLYA